MFLVINVLIVFFLLELNRQRSEPNVKILLYPTSLSVIAAGSTATGSRPKSTLDTEAVSLLMSQCTDL